MTAESDSSGDDILRVYPSADQKARGQAYWHGRTYACALGRRAIPAPLKQEDDGATPVGLFPLRRVYYRPDRMAAPETGLPASEITQDLGWCDDPASAEYNRLVKLPFAASAERLWRDDHKYDLLVTIGHNDVPVRTGAGSAIFLHIASPDFEPTRGCVAFASESLLELVAEFSPKSLIRIYSAPGVR